MPCLNPAPPRAPPQQAFPPPNPGRALGFPPAGREGGLPGAPCQVLFWGPSEPAAVPSFPGDQVSADAVPGTSASRNRQPHLAAGRT